MCVHQTGYPIRCEWGGQGIAALAAQSDAIIIVDVLSFSTCVDVATARGAEVFPCRWKDSDSESFAARHGATLAGSRRTEGFSLSPASLMRIAPGTKLVLPSPNGATLSLMSGTTPTYTGCLRNAAAVARAVLRLGERVSVIPAGERWPDGTLRPALEDWLGAGAILDHLTGDLSPEAQGARDAYRAAAGDLAVRLHACHSGQELIAMGYERDVALAAQKNVSGAVPRLVGSAYIDVAGAIRQGRTEVVQGPRSPRSI